MKVGDEEYVLPPIARSFNLAFCGSCPNAHVMLFDENDAPMAQFVMSATQAEEIIWAISEEHKRKMRKKS